MPDSKDHDDALGSAKGHGDELAECGTQPRSEPPRGSRGTVRDELVGKPGDRREVTRVSKNLKAEFAVEGRMVDVSWTRDLSTKGVLMGCEEEIPLGTPCHLALHVDQAEVQRVLAEGHVVRCSDGCVAMEFTNIAGAESFTALHDALLECEASHESEDVEDAEPVGAPRTS